MKKTHRGYADKRHHALKLILDHLPPGRIAPYSDREIAGIVCISKTTVGKLRREAEAKHLTWADVAPLNEAQRNRLLNKPPCVPPRKRHPDWDHIHAELQRPNVTRQLLWEEYRALDPVNTISYQSFAAHYRRYLGTLPAVMKQTHPPGERVEVDYSGGGTSYVDVGNKRVKVSLFVAALPSSSLIFAVASPSESVSDFIEAHVRMFEFFGGLTYAIVPDNLKAAVITPGPHPYFSRGFRDFCNHCDVQPLPARVRHPKDKPTVECSVRQVKTRILARLRDRTFRSLDELNQGIVDMLTELNDRPMIKDDRSRRERFESMERATLRPLPDHTYAYREFIELPPVGTNYRVKINGHDYSVPHDLIGKTLDARLSATTVEVLHERQVVASHPRSHERGGQTVNRDHMPPHHRAQADRNPDGIQAWAAEVGGPVQTFVTHHFATVQPFRALVVAEDVKRLVRKHSIETVQDACQRAINLRCLTLSSLERFISNGATQKRLPSSRSRTRTARPTSVNEHAPERHAQTAPRLRTHDHGHLPETVVQESQEPDQVQR
ncbi:IS21 family transposase [Dyella humi]|uniref:IS21 family transposase n=1 Tax=Dyella humi TaxID=1770547 RepID=A0ABW8IJL3_9GAMM